MFDELKERIEEVVQRIGNLEDKIEQLLEDNNNASSITVTSPNEHFKITLEATDQGAGLWITEGQGDPIVALYNGFSQGAVVGVYSHHDHEHPVEGVDAAIYAGASEGGFVQLSDRSGNFHSLGLEDFKLNLPHPQ